MKLNRGFTLIEIAIVIGILGLLIAYSIPKYSDMQVMARHAVMQSLHSAMISSANFVYAKSLHAGQEYEENGVVDVDGVALTTRYGFPTEDTILSLMNVSEQRFVLDNDSGKISYKGVENPEACAIDYSAPTNPGDPPIIRLSKQLNCR